MKEYSFEKKHMEHMPVAMAYVPWQSFKICENLEEGFMNGSIFPDLIKPFQGRRCKN